MNISAPLRLCAIIILVLCAAFSLPAAATNWTITVGPESPAPRRSRHENPAIERAIQRQAMRHTGPKVKSQRIKCGELISTMTDGSEVRTPLKRASTARAPEAIARLRIDRALARIAAAEDTGKGADKLADRLEKLADKIEKEARK